MEFTDALDLLNEGCNALSLGELIRDDSLSLYRALTAVELMDERMDAGMAKHADLVDSVDKAIQNGMKMGGFSDEETVGLMDEIIALTVLWLKGNSLPQTVFTCLYTHRPRALQSTALTLFIEAILKLVGIIQHIVLQASCYEEEDFQESLYGFDTCSWKRLPTLIDELETATFDSPIISQRVAMVRQLLVTFNYFSLFQALPRGMQALKGLVSHLSHCLSDCNVGTTFVKQTPDSAFQPHINGHLLAATPPRDIETITRNEAYQYLVDEMQRIQQGMRVFSLKSMNDFRFFVAEFGRIDAGTLSRSVICRAFYGRSGGEWCDKYDPYAKITENIAGWDGAEIFIVEKPLTDAAKHFLGCFQQSVVDLTHKLFLAFFHNRPRQRRKLAKLMDSITVLADTASELDLAFLKTDQVSSANPLTAWAARESCYYAAVFLLLGVELGLHANWELIHVYWYLRHTTATLLMVEQRAAVKRDYYQSHPLMHTESSSSAPQRKGKGKAKPKGKAKGKGKAKPVQNGGLPLNTYPNAVWVKAQQWSYLADGYLLALCGFRKAGRYDGPSNPHITEEVAFQHRFEPLMGLFMPYPATFETYSRELAEIMEQSVSDLFKMAANAFQQAVSSIDKIAALEGSIGDTHERLEKLKMVALRNKILCGVAMPMLQKSESTTLGFDFSQDSTYPLLTLS